MTTLNSDDINRLTPSERLTLIGQLWDSLEDETVPLSDAQWAELDRRLETIDEDRKKAIGWEELKAKMAAQ